MNRWPQWAPASPRCGLCGRSDSGSYRRSSTGATFCSSHPWCLYCHTAHLRVPCDEQLHRVFTESEALRRTRQVLDQLRTLGIDLPEVPLRLTTSMPGPQEGHCIKVHGGIPSTRSARIEIMVGLGPTRFGHVTAHEHTHALLHLHGGPVLNPDVEEGFCELVAVVWLTNQGTSPDVLHAVWRNPHPVYGAQMRRLVRLARREGVLAVLHRVLSTGSPD